MNKKNTEKKSRYLLVILTILCVSMMAMTATDFINIAPLRQAAGSVTLPIQKGLNRLGSYLSRKQESRKDAEVLVEENERLQARVSALEEENTILRENEQELDRLRELFELDGDYNDYDKVAARVISRDPGNWYASFMINQGTKAGIETDMNVLAGGGLAGIVTEVGPNWAYVRPIIDENAHVSAMTLTGGNTCIVSGNPDLQASGRLSFEQMHAEITVSVGEKIVTSDISEKYLEGILIGYVETLENDSNHLTRTGTIIPAVDFENLHEVLVILQKKMPDGEETP